LTKVQSAWSRRKAAVVAEAVAEERAAEDAVISKQHESLAEKTEVEVLEELGLPDPDAMVQGDDFKAFLRKAVPEHLRKRALRTLWRSNPVLACVDGLNDYDDDYLTGSFGQGPISTTYQVGKGMLSHLREVEESVDEKDSVQITPCDSEVEMQEAEPTIATPRRMTFHFEDDAV
jgi:hypothetical protein